MQGNRKFHAQTNFKVCQSREGTICLLPLPARKHVEIKHAMHRQKPLFKREYKQTFKQDYHRNLETLLTIARTMQSPAVME